MSWLDWGKAKPEPNGVILSGEPEGVELSGEEVNIMYEISKKRLKSKSFAQGDNIVGKVCAELISDTDFKRAIARTLKKLFPDQLKGVEIHTSDKKLEQQVSKKILNMR
ncbi:unnamed protein product, partial [marine sediment metagenome]